MENAVGALKIAFSVFVFTIALALAISVVGQARATSDVVFHYNDKTEFYEYITPENGENAEDRIVGMETIIPTIHRYAKEQFAVTIFDKSGSPIVRYDLWTEGIISNWNQIVKEKSSNYYYVEERFSRVQNVVDKTLGKSEENINIEDVIGKLYKVKSDKNKTLTVAAPWVGDNNKILERIRHDIMGKEYEINGIRYNYDGKKHLENYKENTFIEKFIEISTTGETITEEDVSLETIKGNKKLEIIYIMQ